MKFTHYLRKVLKCAHHYWVICPQCGYKGNLHNTLVAAEQLLLRKDEEIDELERLYSLPVEEKKAA